MAIKPPSDIVLDVLNAADPSAMQMAQAQLQTTQAARQAEALSVTDAGFDATLTRAGLDERAAGLDSLALSRPKTEVPEAYRKFESMVLQNFVKTMLPAENEAVFGKGVAGDMWRGMMADQLGEMLAKGGGIGIAEQMARDGARQKLVDKQGHVTFNGDDRRSDIAQQVMAQNQLKALDRLLPGDHDSKAARSEG